MPVDPAAREKAVAELLDKWPWDLGGVIIGGYVSAAYGQPRYSNDIHVVIPVASLNPLIDWLTSIRSSPGPRRLVRGPRRCR